VSIRKITSSLTFDEPVEDEEEAIQSLAEHACDGLGITISREKWDDDSIQFPRLLCEIVAIVEFTEEEVCLLRESMDLDDDQLNSLFERAHVAWERTKEGV
jgi:hypothetical protein